MSRKSKRKPQGPRGKIPPPPPLKKEEVIQKLFSGNISKWNDHRKKDPDWKPDVSGRKLHVKHIRLANLSKMVLNNVDFRNQDLQKANLSCSHLRGANFSKADLRNARLMSVDLSFANLREANLEGSYLRGSYVENADFSHAKLVNANFSKSKLISVNLNGTDLTGANMSQSIFSNLSFIGAKCSNILLCRTKLLGYIFDGLDLKKADFFKADLNGATFCKSLLTDAIFTEANLRNANFSEAVMEGANLCYADCRDANFQNVIFSGAVLEKWICEGAVFDGAYASHIFLDKDKNEKKLFDDIDTFEKFMRSFNITKLVISGEVTQDDIKYFMALMKECYPNAISIALEVFGVDGIEILVKHHENDVDNQMEERIVSRIQEILEDRIPSIIVEKQMSETLIPAKKDRRSELLLGDISVAIEANKATMKKLDTVEIKLNRIIDMINLYPELLEKIREKDEEYFKVIEELKTMGQVVFEDWAKKKFDNVEKAKLFVSSLFTAVIGSAPTALLF